MRMPGAPSRAAHDDRQARPVGGAGHRRGPARLAPRPGREGWKVQSSRGPWVPEAVLPEWVHAAPPQEPRVTVASLSSLPSLSSTRRGRGPVVAAVIGCGTVAPGEGIGVGCVANSRARQHATRLALQVRSLGRSVADLHQQANGRVDAPSALCRPAPRS